MVFILLPHISVAAIARRGLGAIRLGPEETIVTRPY